MFFRLKIKLPSCSKSGRESQLFLKESAVAWSNTMGVALRFWSNRVPEIWSTSRLKKSAWSTTWKPKSDESSDWKIIMTTSGQRSLLIPLANRDRKEIFETTKKSNTVSNIVAFNRSLIFCLWLRLSSFVERPYKYFQHHCHCEQHLQKNLRNSVKTILTCNSLGCYCTHPSWRHWGPGQHRLCSHQYGRTKLIGSYFHIMPWTSRSYSRAALKRDFTLG